jgi:3-hydroxyisobutyrate dehydrogenase
MIPSSPQVQPASLSKNSVAGRKVGFIGTGLMGSGMVHNLLRKGCEAAIYNRTREKAEKAAGGRGRVVDTPAEAARGAEIVFTMLADPAAVTACYEGSDGLLAGLAAGTIVIDSSTISKPATLRLAGQVTERGGRFLDAPVTGSKNEAEGGTLRFLIGGDPGVVEAARPVLEGLGTLVHMGPAGTGITAKLVNNLVVAASLQAFNEGMVLATKAGLDPDAMYALLMSNPRARVGMAELKGPTILKGDFTPHFLLRLMRKDVRLALETAAELGVSMPAVEAVKRVFDASMEEGHGEEDFSAIIRHLESAAGIEVRSRFSS